MRQVCLLLSNPVPTPPLKDADRFMLPSHFEEGKEKCPYDPARGYTGLIVGKQHLSQGWWGHVGCH